MKLNADKILIILHGSIGDVTRALPLVNSLRRGFPEAHIAWSVEPAALPVIENHPAVNEIIVFDRRRWWKESVPFLRIVRARRFDLVLDLQRHLKSGLISFWSGAPYRLGFHRTDSKEFNWMFNNRFIAGVGDDLSKLDHYLKFAEHLGLEPRPVEWRLKLTEAEHGSVRELLSGVQGRYVALLVGTRWESKRWFPDQMAGCAREIRRRSGLESVLLGSPNDVGIAELAEELHGPGLLNLVGKTSLREAIGILGKASVAVGPDTGLMHICAAVGTPVVSLWGATSPHRTGPHGFENLMIEGRAACSPCYLRVCPIGRICMRGIDVTEMAAKVDAVITRAGHSRPTYGSAC